MGNKFVNVSYQEEEIKEKVGEAACVKLTEDSLSFLFGRCLL